MSNATMMAYPAFDIEPTIGGGMSLSFSGLTKREHFAAMAMQGLLASHGARDATAAFAVCQADALLEMLEKTK